MGGFFLNLIISIAIRFGVAILFKRFPFLKDKFPQLADILFWLLEQIKVIKQGGYDSKTEKQKIEEAKQKAKEKIKKKCFGVGCPADLKE